MAPSARAFRREGSPAGAESRWSASLCCITRRHFVGDIPNSETNQRMNELGVEYPAKWAMSVTEWLELVR